MDMIFSTSDHEVINILVEWRATMEKDVKEWSRVGQLASDTL
jgi:hypothetical protein